MIAAWKKELTWRRIRLVVCLKAATQWSGTVQAAVTRRDCIEYRTSPPALPAVNNLFTRYEEMPTAESRHTNKEQRQRDINK